MPWTSPIPNPVDGPTAGPDRPILEGYLGWQRATFLNICGGLSAEQLAARPVATSALSLLGLIRHFAKVDRIWLRQRMAGQDVPPLHGGAGDPSDFVDTDASRARDELEALQDEWRLADAAVADLPFEHPFEVHGEEFSLRMVYVHLIGEYARHNGQADMLREALDGVTGR